MSGMLWQSPAEGGYLWSPNLSKRLRQSLRPMMKFRQFRQPHDGNKNGFLGSGEKFYWNVTKKLRRQGRRLRETEAMPETGFETIQHFLTVYEAGQSVPYTGKLELLAEHDVRALIDNNLRYDAACYFDIEVFLQFDATPLRAAPTGGNSTTSVTFNEDSTTTITNNVELGTGHIKAIVDYMKERNIPPYHDEGSYVGITHPTTLRSFKNTLETLNQYTESGIAYIMHGEIGRYEDVRFVEQNQIPKGGAIDSTTFDPWEGTADAWNNGKSSWAFFMGAETVAEATCVGEQIRAKIPSDYGRSKGIAWYYLGGFGLVHPDAANARIVKWESAA